MSGRGSCVEYNATLCGEQASGALLPSRRAGLENSLQGMQGRNKARILFFSIEPLESLHFRRKSSFHKTKEVDSGSLIRGGNIIFFYCIILLLWFFILERERGGEREHKCGEEGQRGRERES